MVRVVDERRGARTGLTAIVGALGGVIVFLVASQISSSWNMARSDSALSITLALAAALTIGVVVMAIRHPAGAVWAGAVMVVLVVVGLTRGDLVHLQGPLSLLRPQRLSLHGGRSIFVVGLAAATLAIGLSPVLRQRR